jgi:hypothetical protein
MRTKNFVLALLSVGAAFANEQAGQDEKKTLDVAEQAAAPAPAVAPIAPIAPIEPIDTLDSDVSRVELAPTDNNQKGGGNRGGGGGGSKPAQSRYVFFI